MDAKQWIGVAIITARCKIYGAEQSTICHSLFAQQKCKTTSRRNVGLAAS